MTKLSSAVALLVLCAAVVGGLGATIEEVSCKADELGLRSNQLKELIQALTDKPLEAPIGSSSLGDGAVPTDSHNRRLTTEEEDEGSYGVLGLEPNHIGGMEDLQMILPLDWECQTGTSGGVYPCPDGIPSECRMPSDWTAECVACFCKDNAHPCCEIAGDGETAGKVDTSACTDAGAGAEDDDTAWRDGDVGAEDTWTCADYRVSWPSRCVGDTGAFADVNGLGTAADTCLVCDYTDDDTWLDASDDVTTCADFTANPSWCTTYADSADADGDLVGDACAVCKDYSVRSSCPAELADDMWGMHWWEDESIGASYVSYKITRYEMNPDFGVEFYSTEGDTTRVFPAGYVHFKPANAKRSLVLNEQVQYTMPNITDDRRRGRELEAAGHKLPAKTPDLSMPLSHEQIQVMRKAQRKPKPPARRAKPRGRQLRRGGGMLMSSGSFSLSSGSNTAGND